MIISVKVPYKTFRKVERQGREPVKELENSYSDNHIEVRTWNDYWTVFVVDGKEYALATSDIKRLLGFVAAGER